MKTLLAQHHVLSETSSQMKLLEDVVSAYSFLQRKIGDARIFSSQTIRRRNFPGECWKSLQSNLQALPR